MSASPMPAIPVAAVHISLARRPRSTQQPLTQAFVLLLSCRNALLLVMRWPGVLRARQDWAAGEHRAGRGGAAHALPPRGATSGPALVPLPATGSAFLNEYPEPQSPAPTGSPARFESMLLPPSAPRVNQSCMPYKQRCVHARSAHICRRRWRSAQERLHARRQQLSLCACSMVSVACRIRWRHARDVCGSMRAGLAGAEGLCGQGVAAEAACARRCAGGGSRC